MGSVVSAIETAVGATETEVGKGLTYVSHLYSAVEQKIGAYLKEEPQVESALVDLVAKGEIFLAASAPAVSAKGLSLPADSAAFAALESFLRSFESAAKILKGAIAELK